MQNVKKNSLYINPKIKILEIEVEQILYASEMNTNTTPEVEEDDEVVANPYWDVL